MTGRRKSERSTRRKLSSPGRPPVWQREHLCRFWREISAGLSSEEAAVAAGVSAPVGARWFRSSGGMPPTHLAPSARVPTNRSLSFVEREEIALECARGTGVRAIARKLGRSPSTISREIRRNSATRSGEFDYRAIAAQWHADRAAKRPKICKLAVNPVLRDYGECPELCVSGPVHAVSDTQASKRSPNIMANWLRAANHSRTFRPSFSKLRMAR